eukprot:356430-Chlamydomonas_euryale.AAC.4
MLLEGAGRSGAGRRQGGPPARQPRGAGLFACSTPPSGMHTHAAPHMASVTSQPSPLSCAPSKNSKASKSKRGAGPGSNAGRAAKRGKMVDAAATDCFAADDACTLLDVKDIHAMFDSQPEICTQQVRSISRRRPCCARCNCAFA